MVNGAPPGLTAYTGGIVTVVPVTVTVKVQVTVPQLLVAVTVTTVVPIGKKVPEF